uniref:MINAR1 N-terminal helical domain-containing protein n=1 Tax=Knipowitschia caucasica TaxID=637954 RepID=A0AAV2LQ72_KNICA
MLSPTTNLSSCSGVPAGKAKTLWIQQCLNVHRSVYSPSQPQLPERTTETEKGSARPRTPGESRGKADRLTLKAHLRGSVMEHPGEYSTVLGQILSELKSKHQSVSHPELCGWLCSRFDLVHLAKLRSVLFHSASQDPSFPATLFRDRMRCSSVDPHSKKLQVAADVVSMFNLIHSRSPAKERLPMSRAPLIKNHSVGSTDYHPPHPPHPPHPLHGSAHKHKQGAESGLHHFIPASDPNFLLRVSKDLKCRAASLDKLHPLPLYGPGPLGPSCEMQSTYFPMDVDSEASTELESLSQPQLGPQEPRAARSCVHKRNVFKEDFHNMSAFSPKVHRQASDCAEGIHQRELHRPAVFFNHSFELPCTNPYMDPGFNSPLDERHRAKHESLDDLQASTYFGPSTVSESVSSRRFPDREPPHKGNSKAGRPTRPVKSFSLNTDYVPAPSTKPMATKRPLRNMAAINGEREPSKTESPAFNKKVSDFKGQEVSPLSNGPDCVERKGDSPWFEGRTASRGFQRPDVASNVGTQTEKGSEPKRLRSFSRTDSEMISDDISDIFRFLDDMSVCDSLNMIQSSCYNSTGSLSQLTLRSDSSPERSTVRLAKSRLDSLFHSLDNSDDELKSNVHRLVQRIGEIEKKLESLSGVRTEITQLLSKLNQLDHKVDPLMDTHKTDTHWDTPQYTSLVIRVDFLTSNPVDTLVDTPLVDMLLVDMQAIIVVDMLVVIVVDMLVVIVVDMLVVIVVDMQAIIVVDMLVVIVVDMLVVIVVDMLVVIVVDMLVVIVVHMLAVIVVHMLVVIVVHMLAVIVVHMLAVIVVDMLVVIVVHMLVVIVVHMLVVIVVHMLVVIVVHMLAVIVVDMLVVIVVHMLVVIVVVTLLDMLVVMLVDTLMDTPVNSTSVDIPIHWRTGVVLR